MTLVSAFLLASAGALAATSGGDIVARESGDLTLGRNWYPYESAGGANFRWVDRDAEIIIHKPGKNLVQVSFTLEPGPSLGTTQFPFLVLDSSNRQVAGVFVNGSGRTTVQLVLPADPNADNTYRLDVPGGGHKLSADKRVLNFRVFSVSDGPTQAKTQLADIFDPHNGIKLGSHGWYTLENFRGETFRWVSNDADFTVHWPQDQDTQIRAIVEPGPGMGRQPAVIHLQDGSHHDLESRTATKREVLLFPVHLKAGDNPFYFHVDGGGNAAPNDKRTLNFRILGLSALR